ncbi:translation machinery-associated protein 16 [Chamberlinius hualienensis]
MPKAPKSKAKDKVIHPNSRKAWQLARKEHHENRKESSRGNSNVKLNAAGEKMMWFKTNLDELSSSKECYDKSEVKQLVEKYLGRFDEEREQIAIINSIKGRHGRMHASREDNIRFIQQKELNDYDTAGFEIPDLFDKENVKYLRSWNGELKHLCNIITKAVTREELDK